MKIRGITTLLSVVLLIGLAACTSTSQAEADDHAAHHPEDQQDEAEEPADKHKMMEQMCPMKVEDTTRQLVELDDAVAMEFTTTGDVDELRRRVEKMAERHDKMHGGDGQMHHGPRHRRGDDGQRRRGRMHDEMSEEQRQMHRQMMQLMSDVTVVTEEIEDGMRVKFIPDDAGQVDDLYQMMEQHIQMMEDQGRCPMMHMMGEEPEPEHDH